MAHSEPASGVSTNRPCKLRGGSPLPPRRANNLVRSGKTARDTGRYKPCTRAGSRSPTRAVPSSQPPELRTQLSAQSPPLQPSCPCPRNHHQVRCTQPFLCLQAKPLAYSPFQRIPHDCIPHATAHHQAQAWAFTINPVRFHEQKGRRGRPSSLRPYSLELIGLPESLLAAQPAEPDSHRETTWTGLSRPSAFVLLPAAASKSPGLQQFASAAGIHALAAAESDWVDRYASRSKT